MNRVFSTVGSLSLLISSYCFSAAGSDAATTGEALSRDSSLSLGVNYSYVTINTEGLSEFSGNLWGLEGVYEYKALDSIYGAARLAWRQGPVNSSSMDSDIVDAMAEERIGYTFGFNENRLKASSFTFYTGLGFSYLSRKLHFSSSTLKEQYYEYYVPVGFLSEFSLTSTFAIGCDFCWMPQIDSTVGLHPIGGSRWSLQHELQNVSVAIPLTYSPRECFSLILKPFYERWKDGASTATTTTGVPLGLQSNTYNFYGVTLYGAYRF